MIGCFVFLIIITQCSGRIWHISVDGGFLHTREQIMQVMQQKLGVYGGVPGKLVNCFEVEKRLRLDYNEIGWISVEKRGCRLFVRLNESTMPVTVEHREEPCHIIAAQSGIVRRIEVMAGIPQVQVGDVVEKGDILISGTIPIVGDFNELIRKQAVPAEGAVYLESDFSYEARHSLTYEKKIFKNERLGMEIFWFTHKLFSYIPRYSEGKYDIISIDVIPYALDDYKVPLLLRKYYVKQYDTELVKLTEQEIKEKAKRNWELFLKDWETQGVQIIHADYLPEIRGKDCYISGNITACGNFISYQEILEEEWKIEDEYRGNNP